MRKRAFVKIVTDLVIATLVLSAVFNSTVESILGALLFIGGLCMLLIYGMYQVTKSVWLEVHKQKELLRTDTKQNTLNSALFSFFKYYDFYELVDNCTVIHILRWVSFIITGILLYFNLYSKFVIWAANYCVELLTEIINMVG